MASKTKKETTGLRGACMVALASVFEILAPYADRMVLIGGWVPLFLLELNGTEGWSHQGSADLDFLFQAGLSRADSNHIIQLLKAAGCMPRPYPEWRDEYVPFSFLMDVKYGTRRDTVQIDLLGLDLGSGGAPNAMKSATTLALDSARTIEVPIRNTHKTIRVAGAAAMFALKAIALMQRNLAKDGYDIYSLVKYYDNLAGEVRPLMQGPPVRNAITTVQRAFATPEARGPQGVAQYLALPPGSARERELALDAWQTLDTFLRVLKGAR